MITLDARGLPEIQRMLRNLAAEQIPYAVSSALNSTAFAVQKQQKARMPSVFDRPTPLVRGAFRVAKATKQSLTAVVFVDPKRAPVMLTHERGGARGDQRMERYVKSKGWLSASGRAVPTDKMPLNAYGNPQVAEVKRIIAGLPTAKGVNGKRRYFVISNQAGRLSPGIYRADGKALKKLYHFTTTARYSQRLGFEESAQSEAGRLLPDLARAAIQRAIATAR